MHLIVFGDSIAQGFFDTEYNGWVASLATDLQQRTLASDLAVYYSVFNQSISGENTTEIVDRFASEITPRLSNTKKNIVLLAAGINDAKRVQPTDSLYVPLEQTVRNVQQFVTEARGLADEVCVVGLTQVDESLTTTYNNDSFLNADIAQYDAAIKACATEMGVSYIPMHDLIGTTELADGLHPNAAGHRLMFTRVKEILINTGVL